MSVVERCRAGDGLTVVHTRSAGLNLAIVPEHAQGTKISASKTNEACDCRSACKAMHALALHTQLVNLEVQLPHSADDRLFCLVVVTYSERWIFLGKLIERLCSTAELNDL
jgi:hypothetical protein